MLACITCTTQHTGLLGVKQHHVFCMHGLLLVRLLLSVHAKSGTAKTTCLTALLQNCSFMQSMLRAEAQCELSDPGSSCLWHEALLP